MGYPSIYTNFMISRVGWWLDTLVVRRMVAALEAQDLVYSRRVGDLLFHTAVVRLLLPPEKQMHFLDWSYHHTTRFHGTVHQGGLDVGFSDPHPEATQANYTARWLSQPALTRACTYAPAADNNCGQGGAGGGAGGEAGSGLPVVCVTRIVVDSEIVMGKFPPDTCRADYVMGLLHG